MKRHLKQEQKKEEAEERQAKRDALGDQGQLDKIKRLGYYPNRESKRLEKRLSKEK